MSRTLRRVKEKPTQRLPLLRSGRDPAPPFDPAKLALTAIVSLVEPHPAPPFHQSAASAAAAPKGSKHYSLGQGPTGLRPSTRKDTEMAKSAVKAGSIPSYEEELEKLSAHLKAAEEERAQLEAQWRQKYMPDVEELIEFARRRKHPWAQKIEPDNEGIVKETFLVWLYRSTQEQRKIRALETDIEGLKLRIRKAKKMLRLLEGQ